MSSEKPRRNTRRNTHIEIASFPRVPHPEFVVERGTEDGAVTFLRPTQAKFNHTPDDQELEWTSRDQRKARHLRRSTVTGKSRVAPTFLQKLARFKEIEYWNISWWVAMMFTVGSVVWVINSFFAYLPDVLPDRFTFNIDAAGWTAFVGATIFAFASVLLIWEAWNRGETRCFGWSLDQALHKHFHIGHNEKKIAYVEPNTPPNVSTPGGGDSHRASTETAVSVPVTLPGGHRAYCKPWVWWNSDLSYFRELGFLAGFVQLCAATVFWISGFTALPGIQYAIEDPVAEINGVYWLPQVIGGAGFCLSSSLYMLETQRRWYLPNPWRVGWWIACFNLIGSVGFLLSGIFGYCLSHNNCLYESGLTTFWGSWAFLIGSSLQWYEAVNAVSRD